MRLSESWRFVGQALLLASTSHSFRPFASRFQRQLYHSSSSIFASRYELEQLTVVQLKDKLRSLGLRVSGKKAELIDRLIDDEASDSVDTKMAGKTKRAAKKGEEASPKRVRKTKAKSPTKKSPTKKKAADHQRITEIDSISKLWDSDKARKNGSYS